MWTSEVYEQSTLLADRSIRAQKDALQKLRDIQPGETVTIIADRTGIEWEFTAYPDSKPSKRPLDTDTL
jgi:hypothetical protein